MDPINVSEQEQLESAKKPYATPEIIYQAPLEAMASDCNTGGKNPGGVAPCDTSPFS